MSESDNGCLGSLPDFLIIGASRCGTSSFYRNLCQHPGIEGSGHKEIHFFDAHIERGAGWYKQHFPRQPNSATLWFEATPNYLFAKRVPEHVKRLLPAAKFIVLLRNPVDRAWSHYCHLRPPGRLATNLHDPECEVVRKGFYAEQLRRWFSLFSRDQFLVICSEDFFGDSHGVLTRCFHFLGLPPSDMDGRVLRWDPLKERGGGTLKYPAIPTNLRQSLGRLYAPHNAALFELLGAGFATSAASWDTPKANNGSPVT